MSWSIKIKLLATTIASAAMIVMLGFYASFGASIFADKLSKAQMIAAAIRNHTNGDMMHDALRADVFLAFYAASKAPERKSEVIADHKRHMNEFERLIEANKALQLPDQVEAALAKLNQPISAYIATSSELVEGAFENPDSTRAKLDEFERRFSILEETLGDAGDTIEALAADEARAATAFSQQTRLISQVGLILGLLVAAAAVWTTLKDVLTPLSGMTATLRRLAEGEADVRLPVLRKDEIGEMARAIAVFKEDPIERNRLTRESRILSELNAWLQSAKSENELYQMIAEFLSKFLPDCRGSLYIYANSRDMLECVKVWNGDQGTMTMHPDDCWGLRRGRTYSHGQQEIEFHCGHVHDGVSDAYCCIPILAHGETVGLLHLEYAPANPDGNHSAEAAFTEARRLGLASAEHISLAIANVKLRDQLRDQSIRDVLTGLYNRRYMLETSRREFKRAARAGHPVSVLSIDVDHFKRFNDNHGHDAGDAVLRTVGEALRTSFRGEDVPCRFGGEEFVVLLPGAPESVAAERAEQVRAKIEALAVRYGDTNLPKITISIGVASYPACGDTPTEVLKVADEALYVAKRNGRNRVQASPVDLEQDDTGRTGTDADASARSLSLVMAEPAVPAEAAA